MMLASAFHDFLMERLSSGEVGMLLFISIFVGVVIYTFRRKNQSTFESAAHMPLDGDDVTPRLPMKQEEWTAATNAQEERS